MSSRLRTLLAVLALLAGRLVQLTRSANRAADRADHLAAHDALTGLARRQALVTALASCLAADREGTILLIDLDRFGAANDAHGHAVGDALLKAFGRRLRDVAAAFPHRTPGTVGAPGTFGPPVRLWGDSFALLVAGSVGDPALAAAVRKMVAALTAPYLVGGRRLTISMSVGAASWPRHGRDIDALLRAAHAALGIARQRGGSTWHIYDPGTAPMASARAVLGAELAEAIRGGQIVPYYQPIVDMASGEIAGLEVLARWLHPRLGVMAPEIFIPMAAEQHLAGQLSLCLLEQVIRDGASWPRAWRFSFNASPGQLAELLTWLQAPAGLPANMLDPRRIELEVTENALIEDLETAREVVRVLHQHGTHVALDDFGIGYSNFLHLREIPFDRIKIDKSFVIDIAVSPRAEACVRAMLGLGRSLGAEMVAEGVETGQVAQQLIGLGCRLAQGYLYSRPVPAEDVGSLPEQIRTRLGAAAGGDLAGGDLARCGIS